MRDIVSIATLKGFVTALDELALHEEKREASIAARVAGVATQLSAVTEQRDQLMAELSSQRRAGEKVQAQLSSLSSQLALVKRERDELRMVVKQVAADIPDETVALVMRLVAPDQVWQIVLNPNWLIMPAAGQCKLDFTTAATSEPSAAEALRTRARASGGTVRGPHWSTEFCMQTPAAAASPAPVVSAPTTPSTSAPQRMSLFGGTLSRKSPTYAAAADAALTAASMQQNTSSPTTPQQRSVAAKSSPIAAETATASSPADQITNAYKPLYVRSD